MPYMVSFSTPFGPMAILWRVVENAPRIVKILLPPAEGSTPLPSPQATPRSCAAIDDLVAQMLRYFEGQTIAFSLDLVALEGCSPFQKRVLLAEYAIPRGQVSTYGLIAAHLGMPNAARAVGRALATNPFPILIPCHRAIRSDRTLGGYQAGLAMKRALLEMEGVRFSGEHVVGPLYYTALATL
ncbi:MAG: methylated-DNA--[protein]-cysteine S-methyltransferase [Chloroflexi bacterium]|nr:methylated-DNA--[protein]-cysteine S-methyltransferase [Chloroflexota bacterium]